LNETRRCRAARHPRAAGERRVTAERGLGEDNVRALAEQAGMPREQLLSGLSEDLPHFVDTLTPEGRLPDEQEAGQWV
jgi:uncharacterized protein YidB (DUF937 family)